MSLPRKVFFLSALFFLHCSQNIKSYLRATVDGCGYTTHLQHRKAARVRVGTGKSRPAPTKRCGSAFPGRVFAMPQIALSENTVISLEPPKPTEVSHRHPRLREWRSCCPPLCHPFRANPILFCYRKQITDGTRIGWRDSQRGNQQQIYPQQPFLLVDAPDRFVTDSIQNSSAITG